MPPPLLGAHKGPPAPPITGSGLIRSRRVQAAWMMVGAAALFSLMGVGVKKAAAVYTAFEIVGWRGAVGATLMALMTWAQGRSLKTSRPMMHVQRSVAGVTALTMWFYAIAHLPLGTATTMNYMSSIWMALLLMLAAGWRRCAASRAAVTAIPSSSPPSSRASSVSR